MTELDSSLATDSGAIAAYSPAGLARRWCALIYEGVLLFAVCLVAGFLALPIIGPSHSGTDYAAHDQFYVLPPTSRAFLFLLYVAVAGIYCIGFWSSGRRTLPMKTWGLALVTNSGLAIGTWCAIKRYLAVWIGAAAGLAGFWLVGNWGLLAGLVNFYWGWIDADTQFLHDRIAGTRIIRL